MERQSRGPPNQRLNGLLLSAVRPPGSATDPLGANAASRVDSRSAMDTLAAGSSRTESWSRPDDRLATTLAATACAHSVQYVGAPRLARHRSASRFRLDREPPVPGVDSPSHEHGHWPPATLRRASKTLQIPCFTRPSREATVSITRSAPGYLGPSLRHPSESTALDYSQHSPACLLAAHGEQESVSGRSSGGASPPAAAAPAPATLSGTGAGARGDRLPQFRRQAAGG